MRVLVLGAGFGGLELTTRLAEELGENTDAVGDVTSVGTPKAGVFAERQAAGVAAQIVPAQPGRAADKTEFGRSRISRWFGREWTLH